MSKPLAKKRFGQHFLVDRSIIEGICIAIAPKNDQRIVEIGPGPGALTRALLQRIERLHAVEIDRDLAATLRQEFTPAQLDLYEADALRFDFLSLLPPVMAPLEVSSTPTTLRLVGNLPYNISSPLLIRTIGLAEHVSDMHFMLQKEVVMRISSREGHSEFGRLTVMLASCFEATHLFDVPPEAFEPPPRVESAIVRLVTKSVEHRLEPEAIESLEILLARAFAQKRKMLRKTLLPWLEAQGVDGSVIPGTERAEDIPSEVYFGLARQLAKR